MYFGALCFIERVFVLCGPSAFTDSVYRVREGIAGIALLPYPSLFFSWVYLLISDVYWTLSSSAECSLFRDMTALPFLAANSQVFCRTFSLQR